MNNAPGKKKIVVTGASGFLGRNLVERLRTDGGFVVYALSSMGDELQESNTDSGVIFCHKDVFMTNDTVLRDAVIVNCAFPRNSTGTGMADGLRYIRLLFDCAVDSGAEAIINISSQSVYSAQRTEAATEETPVCLESPYAVGKYATELMLESACRGSRTKFTNLRMASLIGPGFDQRVVNRFVLKILNRESVVVTRQKKEMGFLDVQDAVSAILLLIVTSKVQWRPFYNSGNNHSYSIEEIFSEVSTIVREKTGIVARATFEDQDDRSSSKLSFEALRFDTGFEPQVTLRSSIERIVEFILKLQHGV